MGNCECVSLTNWKVRLHIEETRRDNPATICRHEPLSKDSNDLEGLLYLTMRTLEASQSWEMRDVFDSSRSMRYYFITSVKIMLL